MNVENRDIEVELPAELEPTISSNDIDLKLAPEGETFDSEMHAALPIMKLMDDPNLVGVPVGDIEIPKPVNLPADVEMVHLFINKERLQTLWKRSEVAQKEVYETINQVKLASYLLQLLEQARNQILGGKANYEEAERLLSIVEHRIAFNRRMAQTSRKFGSLLLGYELAWMVFLAVTFVIVNMTPLLSGLQPLEAFPSIRISHFFNSIIWGAMGGVVGALYALWTHIADKQDFDPQYNIWYITNPILGVGIGAFVFLIIQAGFLSMTGGSSGNEPITSAAVIYVFAWVCGFKQNVVYELVRRILDVFRVNGNKEEENPNDVPVETPTPEGKSEIK